ncbi:ribonuclease HII [Corynebacterium sp. ES2775-CONJ]|uniref:ribonuclease HII n=1 Tax=Corynebacterium sp. ES2775-CONJ TaxID=2974029 RepID=UPI002169E7E1|nr:ribonuclease HII [Corynebacterium sp. ES2775-CONJ]MCS4489086.1 ribonuclease HII [Corynebacterium sp. ES2775-CONJ]
MRTLKYLRTFEVALDKAGLGPVAGVDEAGRGSCAGPITIAACILPSHPIAELAELTDSKKLTPLKRAQLYPLILRYALASAIVHISAPEIDIRGIQNANTSGMRRAVAQLKLSPHYILTDALRIEGFSAPSLPIIGGDSQARCIAAASVLAKYARDTVMEEYHEKYPVYNFARHKGYGTREHIHAVRLHGASPIHRYSYANIAAAHKQWLAQENFPHQREEQIDER